MDAIFSKDFGSLGMVLIVFVIAFTAVLMPMGIYVVMKRMAKQAGEQEQANSKRQ